MLFVDVGVDAGAAVAVFGRFAKQIGFNICYCMSETLLNMICIIVRFLFPLPISLSLSLSLSLTLSLSCFSMSRPYRL